MKSERIRSSDCTGYHIVSMIFVFFGIGDIIWFLSGWIIFEYVIMDVRMRFKDMEICTHSSFKPYEVVQHSHRHLWLESSFLIWTLSYLFCHLPRVSFFTFLVIVDIRVSRGILKERNRWWLSHENEWSLRHLRAHLMCYRDLKLAYLVRLWFLKSPCSRE